ncbi:MAG: hypothetical protein KGD63_06935 [Candidatus Lokiarchaeota archaeon]|nr:hypothetical protein [Candidatus Lokiarchaeota archaeon]
MNKAKPKCFTCKHNLTNSSNGPCASKGVNILNKISNSLGIEISDPNEEINELKHFCKIIKKYPEDYDILNPYKCIYYFPSYYRMF